MTSYLKRNENSSLEVNSRTDATTSLMYLMMFVAFFREFLVFLGLTAISTLFYYLMIVIVAAICGLVIIRMLNTKYELLNILQFFGGILICVCLLLSNILDSSFSFGTHGTQMIGIMLLTLFLSCEWVIKVTKQVVDFYLWLNFFTSIYLTLGIFVSSNYLSSDLIYNYASTNQAGIVTMLTALHLVIQFALFIQRKKYLLSTMSAVMFCMMFLACYLTKSRACLLAIAAFLVIYLCMSLSNTFIKVISVILIAAPVVFPLIWITFFNILGADSDITVFGKPLFSGRESIWLSIIDNILENPFTLNISQRVSGEVGDHSAHNAIWEMIWSYTVWFAAVYFAFLSSKVRDAYKCTNGKITLVIFASLLVLFFHMCFETTMISGAVNFTIKAFTVIPLLRGVENDIPFKSFNSRTGLQRSKYLR